MHFTKQSSLYLSFIRSDYYLMSTRDASNACCRHWTQLSRFLDSTVREELVRARQLIATLVPIDCVLQICVYGACYIRVLPNIGLSAVAGLDKAHVRKLLQGAPLLIKELTGFYIVLAAVAPTPPDPKRAAEIFLFSFDGLPPKLQAQSIGILESEYPTGHLALHRDIGVRDRSFYRISDGRQFHAGPDRGLLPRCGSICPVAGFRHLSRRDDCNRERPSSGRDESPTHGGLIAIYLVQSTTIRLKEANCVSAGSSYRIATRNQPFISICPALKIMADSRSNSIRAASGLPRFAARRRAGRFRDTNMPANTIVGSRINARSLEQAAVCL